MDDTQEEASIKEAHKKACELGLDFYEDPKTRYTVMTSLYLVRRGFCCRQNCRHCPYKDSSN